MRWDEATDQPRAGKSGKEESSLNRGSREPDKLRGNNSGPTKAALGRAEAEAELRVNRSLISRRSDSQPKQTRHASYHGGSEEADRAAKQGVQGTADNTYAVIPFRVFEDLRKCLEAEEILKWLVLPS